MKTTASSIRVTARQNLVSILALEILNGAYDPKFPIPSEHQLCRRFGVSRVTVRLALSDLQNRGLIYRHHGKGTFIYGSGQLQAKPLAILLRKPELFSCPGVAQLLQGIQSFLSTVDSYSVWISQAPDAWSPELATSLGGVLVIPQEVTPADLDILTKRNLPYLIAGLSDLHGPTLGVSARTAVYDVTTKFIERGLKHFAFIRGQNSPYDETKLTGALKAISVAGLGADAITTVSCSTEYAEIRQSVKLLLGASIRPEVIIAA